MAYNITPKPQNPNDVNDSYSNYKLKEHGEKRWAVAPWLRFLKGLKGRLTFLGRCFRVEASLLAPASEPAPRQRESDSGEFACSGQRSTSHACLRKASDSLEAMRLNSASVLNLNSNFRPSSLFAPMRFVESSLCAMKPLIMRWKMSSLVWRSYSPGI